MNYANSLYLLAKVDSEAKNPSKQIFVFAKNSWKFLWDEDACEEWTSPYLKTVISLSGETSDIPLDDELMNLNNELYSLIKTKMSKDW